MAEDSLDVLIEKAVAQLTRPITQASATELESAANSVTAEFPYDTYCSVRDGLESRQQKPAVRSTSSEAWRPRMLTAAELQTMEFPPRESYIEGLIVEGRLRFPRPLGYRVTYHDPCYLARYNGEIDAPRDVMRALGLELEDMPRCGANTFCCGAGGGRIWMDTSNEQKRTSEQRIEEALALGDIAYFVTTCPKDYTMYTDAVKSLGAADRIEVKDLIELVTETLALAEDPG